MKNRRRVLSIAIAASGLVLSPRAALADGPVQTLHTFRRLPSNPSGKLAIGPDGTLYGTTQAGGLTSDGRPGLGTVYALRAQPDGQLALTTLHVFAHADGLFPRWGLTLASDGYLYGTTSGRIHLDSICLGPPNCGAVFRMSTSGQMTLLHLFTGTDGAYPNGGLIQAADGNLYGVTKIGPNGGTIFRVTLPAGTLTTIASVNGNPLGDLAEDADGNFYLAAENTSNVSVCGGIFRVTKAGAVTKMHQLGAAGDLCAATSGLIRGADGNFYGAASGGLYKMTPDGGVTVLHAFANSAVKHLMQGSDGAFYGLTAAADTPYGSVFRVDASGVFTTLHEFNRLDGAIFSHINGGPPDSLTEIDGVLVGTAGFGGGAGCGWCGTLFALTRDGAFFGARPFEYSDGGGAVGGLIRGSDGAFYGTALLGPKGVGEVFRITPAGQMTILHAFGGPDGASPFGGVVEANDGNLYGTTAYGGTFGLGTIFRITPGGSFTTLHAFKGSDGAVPACRLLQGADGNLYGTTMAGGASNRGSVFKITRAGVFTLVHSFSDADGAQPIGGLVRASNGLLYGTTWRGGGSNQGVIFVMTTGGAFAVLHSFVGIDSEGSFGALTEAADGNLYGTSSALAAGSSMGSIFRTTPGGAFSIVTHVDHSEFLGGYPPAGELIRAADGSLYGLTATGFDGAAVFKITLDGQVTPIATVPWGDTIGSVAIGVDGALYFATFRSRLDSGLGAVYRVDPNAPPVSARR